MSIHIRFRVGLSGYRRYKYAPESTRFSNLSEKDTYMCTIYIELTRKLHLPKTEESSSWHCMKKEKKNKYSYLLLLSTFTLSFFLLFPFINLSSSPTGVMVWSLLTPCMSLIEAPLASKYSVSQKSNMWLEVCIRVK